MTTTDRARNDSEKVREAYRQGELTVRDHLCATCGGELVNRWNQQRQESEVACPRGDVPLSIVPRRQVTQEAIRERIERDPRLVQALAIQGVTGPRAPVSQRQPLTTEAIRALDNEKLLARIPSKYGDALVVSAPQRLQIAQLARLYGLDPLTDLMIYEGKPYVTYDGRLRKLRENGEYRGHKVRPMDRAEKDLWGYEADDIVLVCDVDMGMRGLVTDYGVVRRSEIDNALETQKRNNSKKPAPVGSHPQQIALKRAIARASRMAVGIDLPTMIDAQYQVVEVSPAAADRAMGPDPHAEQKRFWVIARDELNLSRDDVHRLLKVESVSNYPGGWSQALSDLTERASEGPEPELEETSGPEENIALDQVEAVYAERPRPTVDDAARYVAGEQLRADQQQARRSDVDLVDIRSPEADRLARAIEAAATRDIPFDTRRVEFPAPRTQVLGNAEHLEAAVAAYEAEDDGSEEPAETATFPF